MKSFALLSLLFIPLFLIAQDKNNLCLKGLSYHIVVLGSSTAAGTGPSSQDSAWVWRYRRAVQDINPGNQVTNLAVGGTTTYHILPDGTTPPAGRPAPTPAKNISQAISLGADAIIVNMPSNDAALGFTTAETLENFRVLDSVAASLGIPIWICTTQPRNFSAAKRMVQVEVKDSVLAQYGSFAIDFWTTFADSTSGVLPQYDSGDGTHLNDTAHAILLSLVEEKQILSALYEVPPTPDIATIELIADPDQRCGETMQAISAVILNPGQTVSSPIPLQWSVSGNGSSTVFTDTLFSGLQSCTTDTVTLLINTSAGGVFDFTINVLADSDTFLSNNSLSLQQSLFPSPLLVGQADTICEGELATVSVSSQYADTIFWYDSSGTLIGSGDSLTFDPAAGSGEVYAQAVAGELFFKESLFTRDATNRTWNGIMFDLMGSDDILIDSLDIKVFSTGSEQLIDVFWKQGSHLGFENDSSAWALWTTDTIDAPVQDLFLPVRMNELPLNAGDTVGLYLTFRNPGNRLYYEATGSTATKSTAELSVFSGTGITHRYGTTYYPRDWAGEVYYHFGTNLEGQCASDLLPLTAVTATPEPLLGSDTTVSKWISLSLNPGTFSSYLWQDGSSGTTFVFPTDTIPGTYLIWVEVSNNQGCVVRDSLTVTVENTNSLPPSSAGWKIYPNPAQNVLRLEGLLEPDQITIWDMQGRLLEEYEKPGGTLSLPDCPEGLYLIQIKKGENSFTQLLRIIR